MDENKTSIEWNFIWFVPKGSTNTSFGQSFHELTALFGAPFYRGQNARLVH